GGGCVSDGPFKNAILHLGPSRGIERNDHCLTRNFHPHFPARWFSETEVNRTMAEGSYGRFWRHLEGMFEVERMDLHGAGHLGIGDPLFYLHHANLDRLWWKWQEQNPQPRLKEVSGPVLQKQGAGNVTLAYEIDFGKIARKVNIADVMHIQQKALCYDYP
ncbi:Di-copper centre-containing protein, partial [Tuber magnatum]